MSKMKNEFFLSICMTNGIDTKNLSKLEIEFQALGFLGYTGTINDRRRAFYQSRTGTSWLEDAINANTSTNV